MLAIGLKKPVVFLAAATLLAACAGEPGPMTGAGVATGALAGAGIGALAGGGGRSVVAGAIIGGLVGGVVGNALDEEDRRRAYAAEMRALEHGGPGTPVTWRGERGAYGTIVAGPQYAQGSHARCRDYTHTIYINGRPEAARGVACRNPDGSWTPVG